MAKKKATKTTARTPAKKAPAKARKGKKAPGKAASADDRLLADISKDVDKLLEAFLQKQYEALSDFASDIVVATAKQLMEHTKG